jgi:alginate O-acetyltransferase complex protein AlgI
LWHGASWNFILWGGTLFILISMEKLFLKKLLTKLKILPRIYVLFIMPLTWMIFAISKLSELRIYLGRMFAVVPGVCVNTNDFAKYFGIYHWYFLFGAFFCMPVAWNWYIKYEKSIVCTFMLFIIFWYAVYQLANGLNNPFLYFKY